MKKIAILMCFLLFISLNARQKIGLVLSGGGAKGLAHIGVLKVLEEANIRPDYITGTSMGGIIGGLYAIGYTPAQLEQMVKAQNWEDLLLDVIPHNYVTIQEKEDKGNFALQIDINDYKIKLPSGMVKGQNLGLLLSKLTWHVQYEDDFNNFPIPFACVATNIETGEAVVLNKGLLPEALRATMSIPTAFTPIEIDEKLLVDGGVVRNLPVGEAKDMGADFIIGVNVGSPLRKKEKLNDLIAVMTQAIGFAGEKSVTEAENMCDILIKPDITGFSMTSFNKADSLIARGKKAALKQFDVLKTIGRKNNRASISVEQLKNEDKLPIVKIKTYGQKKVSSKLIRTKLKFDTPAMISIREIEKRVQRLYATGFFETVTYSLMPIEEGLQLNVKLKEKLDDKLQLGLHYNSETEAGLVFNTVIRNKLFRGERFSLSALLSGFPQAKASYFIYTGYEPGIGLGIKASFHNYETFLFDPLVDNKKLLSAEFRSIRSSIELQSLITHSATIGVGFEKEFDDFETIVTSDLPLKEEYEFSSLYAYYIYDTISRKAYPEKGTYLKSTLKAISKGGLEFKDKNNYRMFLTNFKRYFKLSKSLTLIKGAKTGFTFGNDPHSVHYMLLGGNTKTFENIIWFAGLNRFELAYKHILSDEWGLQYEVYDNLFLQGIVKFASVDDDFDELFKASTFLVTYGLHLGWLSPIGPIELSAYKCNKHKTPSAYFKIGYDF